VKNGRGLSFPLRFSTVTAAGSEIADSSFSDRGLLTVRFCDRIVNSIELSLCQAARSVNRDDQET
jgi:hypothetical protein